MFSCINFDNYKGFTATEKLNSICDLKRVNIFIGKNNSGKSSVLDVISCIFDLDCLASIGQKIPNIEFGLAIEREHIDNFFAGRGRSGHYNSSAQFCGLHGDFFPLTCSISSEVTSYSRAKSYKRVFNPSEPETLEKLPRHLRNDLINDRLSSIDSSLKKYSFKRLSAERNIVPEPVDAPVPLDAHGTGASSLIAEFLTVGLLPEEIIEDDLLNALNEIMYPDAVFQSIRVQKVVGEDDMQKWEIFLQEKGCKRFPLSQSGSGLKTIILLLLNLLVVPETKEYKDKYIAYGFEELENNLHPYLQRKIFDYIYKFAESKGIYVFITTHSHIAINAFFDKKDAAIYHITKQDNISSITKIQNHIDKISILHDLDVKASDLFQANGIIWVEGPSDRIYIKRWLEVFFDIKFQEGVNYQFLYYGGKNLSHYTYTDGEVADLINILTTNPNAAIVMDSDKRSRSTPKGEAKKRIEAEFKDRKMFSWITKGTDIENYISVDAINEAYNYKLAKQCAQYEKFSKYIEPKLKSFSSRKVAFAHRVKNSISIENSTPILDLKQRIEELYLQIETWNK